MCDGLKDIDIDHQKHLPHHQTSTTTGHPREGGPCTQSSKDAYLSQVTVHPRHSTRNLERSCNATEAMRLGEQ
jgi:hypothetical protein